MGSSHSPINTNTSPTFTSTVKLLITKMPGAEQAILGGKTGYTPEAGLCLASLLEKNGNYFLLITANATGNVRVEPLHVQDALSIHSAL